MALRCEDVVLTLQHYAYDYSYIGNTLDLYVCYNAAYCSYSAGSQEHGARVVRGVTRLACCGTVGMM